MNIPITKPYKLDDGKHNGVIREVEYRIEPHNYTEPIIELADGHTIKASYPTVISSESGLGKLLVRFGAQLIEGNELDPNGLLVGQKVEFVSVSKPGKNGREYANVIPESLKPTEELVLAGTITEEKIE